MRAHVEFVHEDDLIWHMAELPHGEGTARQRNLSVDEEDGSASLRVDFISAFTRPAGRHAADTEWFVMTGHVRLGERVLGSGGYFRAPQGVTVPAMQVDTGTRVLLYRQYGDWAFEPQPDKRLNPADLTILDTQTMPWSDVEDESVPKGIALKLLFEDPKSGFFSYLSWCKAGWRDNRLYHHHVFEDCYTLAGRMTYNYGELVPGTYFFRPPYVKHGGFVSDSKMGCQFLGRSDGRLVRMYTNNSRVFFTGEPQNYDPETEGPTIAGVPVRSRRAGEWDGEGR